MESFLINASRQAVFRLHDLGDIIAARRAGTDLAHNLQLGDVTGANAATIIVEAATNIVKHAVEGEIVIRAVSRGALKGIEILAIDSGPGMFLPKSGTHAAEAVNRPAATGLRQIGQLASRFDYFSGPGKGTVLWMQVWEGDRAAWLPAWDIGVVCLPIPSEDACGDAWEAVERVDGLSVIVADGLGHGPEAALASHAAVKVVQQHANCAPADTMHRAHDALNQTRGAAVAVAQIDEELRQLHFAGVGNIAARVITNGVCRHLMSHNGIVGSNLRKVEQLTFPWAADSMLIMQSDGIGARWDLKHYPGLIERHPALIAAVLYRDFLRPRDDAAIVAIRRCLLTSAQLD